MTVMQVIKVNLNIHSLVVSCVNTCTRTCFDNGANDTTYSCVK